MHYRLFPGVHGAYRGELADRSQNVYDIYFTGKSLDGYYTVIFLAAYQGFQKIILKRQSLTAQVHFRYL